MPDPGPFPHVELRSLVQADRPITYGIVQPGKFVADGIPLVRGRDYSFGWRPLEELVRVTPGIEYPYRRARLRPGDLLITIVGAGTGNTAVVPDHLGGANITQTTARVAVDPAKADPSYVLAILRSEIGQNLVYRHVKGGAQPGLNLGDLERFRIPLPGRAAQKMIAEVADEWDWIITTTEALTDAKTRQFAWLRSEVLSGTVRLGGFSKPWRSKRLAAVLHEHGDRSTGCEAVFSVSVHRGLVNQIEHLGRSFAASDTRHYNRVKPGDVVYTKSPTGDFPLGIIKQSKVDQDVIVSPLYGVFTPATPELGTLLDAYFSSPFATERYLAPLVQKGAKNTISVTNAQFLEGTVALPEDDAEICALAELVDTSRREIVGLSMLAEARRRQKRGLMQKLLTGELRVPGSAAQQEATK